MAAIPLAATVFTAIIRWQRNKELRPSAEASCLGSALNLYGAMRTTGSSRSEPAPFTMEGDSTGSVWGVSRWCTTVMRVNHTPRAALSFLHRQHLARVCSSELCVPVAPGLLSANHQPGHLQHLLNHPRWRLLLPPWHPCAQPVVDYERTLH